MTLRIGFFVLQYLILAKVVKRSGVRLDVQCIIKKSFADALMTSANLFCLICKQPPSIERAEFKRI